MFLFSNSYENTSVNETNAKNAKKRGFGKFILKIKGLMLEEEDLKLAAKEKKKNF